MIANELNVHCNVTDATYRRILDHAKQLGIEPKVQKGTADETLFMTIPVTLYVNPSAKHSETVAIHDRTYSKNVMRVEQNTGR